MSVAFKFSFFKMKIKIIWDYN